MPSAAMVSSKLSLVARRIEADIKSRGLESGDLYLSVSDAATMLGVSPATAHRAMDLLVNRRLLARQQGRGTFVGEAIAHRRPSARVRTVFILISEEQEGVTSVELDAMVTAVRHRIGGVNVQFSFVPQQGSIDYVRELITSAQNCGQYAGAIPISCSREVYRYLGQAGGPIVVLGSLYADQSQIPSTDIDFRQVGRLLADYLVGRGHTRMALLTTGEGRPGDHAFFDGVSDALTDAGLPHNALTVRIFRKDFEIFRGQVRELLERTDRPTGLICHTARIMGASLAVVDELGLSAPGDIEVAFQGHANSVDDERFARVEPKVPFRRIAEIVAEMLRQLSDGKKLDCERVVIPVELYSPGQR